jgi:hypothetical protein
MRGTWQGSGTWETTSGSPAPLIFGAVAVVAVIAAVDWLLARIFWLLGASAALVFLAAAALWLLIRRQQRREAAHAERSFIVARERPAAIPASPRRELPAPVINVNIYTADGVTTAARIIRNAITEGK